MQIKINDVEFGYTSVPVLKDITLDISGAQLVSILGPNGVGKSTLIHCINNILTPTSGTVFLDDRDVKTFKLKELAKLMGYVPYSSSDSFPLTVVDTVLMGRHPHSNWKSTEKDLDIVYDTLEMLGIEHLAMRPFNELSAGQHQKVMLARGFAQEPKVLLLDEPTANMDSESEARLFETLGYLKKSTIIMIVTHDTGFVSSLTDVVLCVGDRKSRAGTRDIVRHRTEPATNAPPERFGGSAARVLHNSALPDSCCGGNGTGGNR